MPHNDGKDRFYRTLDLDKETMKIVTGYRKWKDKVITDRLEDDENVYSYIKKQNRKKRKS